MPNRIFDSANKKSNYELSVRQNCLITNEDPKKSNNINNKLSIALSKGQTSNVTLNHTQFRLLEALAHGNDCDIDDNDDILTEKDLKLAKERFKTSSCVFRELGVVEFRYDEKRGIANITTKKGEVLRVDLETKFDIDKKNKKGNKTDNSKVNQQANAGEERKTQAKQIENVPQQKSDRGAGVENKAETRKKENTSKPKTTGNVNYLTEPKSNTPVSFLENIELPPRMRKNKNYLPLTNYDDETGKKFLERAQKPRLFRHLPKEYAPYIKQLAKNAGVSEYFVKNLVSLEAFIPKAKNIGDGVLTIGFGHTNTANHNRNFKKGEPITIKKAFEWLEQDIKDNINYARRYFTPQKGEFKGTFEYDALPQSFKEALIDIAFNRGTNVMASENIYKSLRANFREGCNFMPAAAVRTRQENFRDPNFEGGLRRRNVYRFLMAIRDLSGEYKLAAMRRFERNEKDAKGKEIPSYLDKTMSMLKGPEKIQLQKDWNAAKRAAEYQAQKEFWNFGNNFVPEKKRYIKE